MTVSDVGAFFAELSNHHQKREKRCSCAIGFQPSPSFRVLILIGHSITKTFQIGRTYFHQMRLRRGEGDVILRVKEPIKTWHSALHAHPGENSFFRSRKQIPICIGTKDFRQPKRSLMDTVRTHQQKEKTPTVRKI